MCKSTPPRPPTSSKLVHTRRANRVALTSTTPIVRLRMRPSQRINWSDDGSYVLPRTTLPAADSMEDFEPTTTKVPEVPSTPCQDMLSPKLDCPPPPPKRQPVFLELPADLPTRLVFPDF